MRGRRFDVAMVAVFTVSGLVELTLTDSGSWPVMVPAAIGFAAALWWRARDPWRMLAITLAAGIAAVAVEGQIIASYFALIVAVWSLGRWLGGRERLVAVTVLAVFAATREVIQYGVGDAPFQLVIVFGLAAVGGLVRARAELTRELAERTHELDAERAVAEQAAALEERRRIARELHDVIAHSVSVMVVQAGGARRQLARDPRRALEALEQIELTGQEARTEVQRLFGLLGDATSGDGLAALGTLAERTSAAGLPIEVVVEGGPRPLDPEADLAALRLVQEALTNTLKHAGPATARVLVRWGDAELELVVSDTGWGEDGPRGDGSRRGLVGMRERIEPFGGEVQAGPRAAGGFEVRARLPLAREEVPA